MTEMEIAVARMNNLWTAANEAKTMATAAEAEVARLTFLDYVARYPTKVKGFSFESEYQYNDEGGYFLSTSVYPLITECTATELDEYELQDTVGSYSQEALALLCGVHGDSYSGECTVEQARERRF